MAEVNDRLMGEFRRMDDELAAGVALPSIDSVVRRTGTVNRVTTAAAAAVFTVGSLGTITAVAQAGIPPTSLEQATTAAELVPAPAAVPGPSEGEQERAAAATTTSAPTTTTRRPVVTRAKPKIVVTTRARPTVVVPVKPTTVKPAPTTTKRPPTTTKRAPATGEGTADPGTGGTPKTTAAQG